MDVRQSEIATSVAVRQTLVVKAHQAQDRSVQVVNGYLVANRRVDRRRSSLGQHTVIEDRDCQQVLGRITKKSPKTTTTTTFLNPRQLCDPSALDPLGDVDIPLEIETGVMGMDELALLPAAFVGSNRKSLALLLVGQDPVAIIPNCRHGVVISVE